MEIHIGIVECELFYKNQLLEHLEKWILQNNCKAVYHIENSGETFLLHLPVHLDILFLDIRLEKMNGLELARRLRVQNYNCEIVFLTAFKEYVFQGYHVRALNYLLKPASYSEIKACMDLVLKRLKVEYYIYKKAQSIYKIPYANILFFSSSNHYVEIITHKQTYQQLECIKNILTYLPPQFLQCHRTTIINIQHVQWMEKNNVMMDNGMLLPVSKTYIKSIRNNLMKTIS